MSVDDAITAEAQRAGASAWRPRISRAAIARSSRSATRVRRELMADRTYLDWPFLDDAHRALARDVTAWRDRELLDDRTIPIRRRPAARYVTQLGAAGWLKYAVPRAYGGALDTFDVRSICLIRETLGYASGLAEFAFAMQGLGSGADLAVRVRGAEAEVPARPWRRAKSIAAFAISEAGAGSDLSAMTDDGAARRRSHIVIDGEKTWISNAGIAAHYVVFCRWPEGGDRSFIALVVDAGTPGLDVSGMIDVLAPHPLGTLTIHRTAACRPTRSSASRARACASRWARSTCFARRSAPRRWGLRDGRSTRRSRT